MKYIVLLFLLLASPCFSDSKTDTTIVPKKAGGSVIISGGTGQVLIKGSTVNVRASEGAGTTTLTSSDLREQIFNLSAARTVKLPSTGIRAGDKWTFKNTTTYNLSIQPSGAATTIATANSLYGQVEATALINTPSAAADWQIAQDQAFDLATPGATLKSGTGGYSYEYTSAVNAGWGDYADMITATLNKGVYLAWGTAQCSVGTSTGRLYVNIVIGGAQVGQPSNVISTVTQEVTATIVMPAVITTNGTTLILRGRMYDQGSSSCANSMRIVKLRDL